MSGFTTQIKTIVEHYSQRTPDLPIKEKIEIGRKGFFDFDYPFFDENYKKIFETNFLKYFYMYEIGQETEGLFQLRLDTWLNINMPYYNKLFESEQLTYNPLENFNVKKDRNRNNLVNEKDSIDRKGNATTNSNSSSDSKEQQSGKQSDKGFVRDIQADTPESRLQLTTNANGTGVIEYASGIGENSSNGSSESTGIKTGTSSGQGKATSDMTNNEEKESSLNQKETETQTDQGKIGVTTYQEMIQEYRKTFINVERLIFENMRKDGLFMLIYN